MNTNTFNNIHVTTDKDKLTKNNIIVSTNKYKHVQNNNNINWITDKDKPHRNNNLNVIPENDIDLHNNDIYVFTEKDLHIQNNNIKVTNDEDKPHQNNINVIPEKYINIYTKQQHKWNHRKGQTPTKLRPKCITDKDIPLQIIQITVITDKDILLHNSKFGLGLRQR